MAFYRFWADLATWVMYQPHRKQVKALEAKGYFFKKLSIKRYASSLTSGGKSCSASG